MIGLFLLFSIVMFFLELLILIKGCKEIFTRGISIKHRIYWFLAFAFCELCLVSLWLYVFFQQIAALF